ncbi:hypothetical protein CSUI_009554 [Cystoisospora suis]|uniref:Uncharacterized protein n=1 Tax=Cystoisospora suis TaxID=483139 RepID=A0A2C6KHN5_9APIC|nr:hypothetical protein CSUI_009554 [Cystoisospora suis]
MRASRVFPQRGSGKCTNVRRALRHGATASLASQLHLCWKALGVTPSTLKTLLQEAVFTAGARTRSTRGQLIVGLVPSLRRGVDPQAQAAFESEGPVFAAAVASWNPLSLLRQWTDDGVLKLRKEDKEGLLGRFLDGASSIPPGDHAGRSAELSQASAADMPVQSTKSSSSSVSKTTAKFPQDRPFRTVDAAAFLSLSTAVARELDRGTFTHAHVATAAEREVWTDILVAEEAERFESLTASMKAFDGEENPTSDRINDVLASAILGQLTLLRMSRVLPTSHSTKCLNATRALAHPPTATLAAALRQSWNALGVTDSTVKALLCKVVLVIGRETWAPRERLYLRLKRQSSEEPPSHEALAPEASVFSAAIAAWDPVTRLRQWIAAGDLTLSKLTM